jgi:DUF4097 and DUF4098 domain-containing protein YvlB
MWKQTIVLVLAIAAAALPASAERVQVDETRPAAADGEVSVELLAGTVEIIGWDRNEVHVTGSIDDEFEELEIDAGEGEISIEVEISGHERRSFDGGATLKIRVPTRSEIGVEVISADISVEDVAGEVEIEAISGRVICRGAIEEIGIECVSGDVTVETTADLRRASIETVSGGIELSAALGHSARVRLESVNGDVVLRLPSSTSADFEISTFNGSIRNDFGPQAEKTSKYLPARELSFSLGSGDARVVVEAFNGTVRLVEE